MKQNILRFYSIMIIFVFIISAGGMGIVFPASPQALGNDDGEKYTSLSSLYKNPMGTVDIIIYYDSTSITPLKLTNLFLSNPSFNEMNVRYVDITSISSFEENLYLEASIKYFIFHGFTNGFTIGNELYSWNQFAGLALSDTTNFYVFLSCNSGSLNTLLPSKVIMSAEGEIDYKVAYFNGLLYVSDYFKIIQEDQVQGKKFYELATNYFVSAGYDIMKRYQSPIETLGGGGDSPDDSPLHGIYLAMYEDIQAEFGKLDQIARKYGYLGIIQNVLTIYTGFMTITLSFLTAGVGSVAGAIFNQIISYVAQAVEQNSGASSPETYANNALDQYATTIKDKIKDNFVSKGVNKFEDKYLKLETTHTGSLMDAIELVIQMYAFANKYTETTFTCDSKCASASTQVYLYLSGQNTANLNPNYYNILQKLENFNTALHDNWDNILSSATALKSEASTVLTALNIYPGPIASIARSMLTELKTSLTSFIDYYYDQLDSNGAENTMAEITTGYSYGSYIDDFFRMKYTVKNLGSSQGGIDYVYSYTSTNQGFSNSQTQYMNFFLAPGESLQGEYDVHKHWFTLASASQSVTIKVDDTADFKGSVITSKRWGSSWFPKTGYSQLSFSLGGGQKFSKIYVSILRVLDAYSRTFKVFAGGIEKYKKVVGVLGFSGEISLGGSYTSVILEIAWAGWIDYGWLMGALVTY